MALGTSAREMMQKISDTIWEVPTTFKESMRVPARIYATEKLLREMDEAVFDQVTNVATLPGITQYAFCMPDGHSGYGFPIGGVAAMDIEAGGVISPGGIGFDINCGMRLVVTNLTYDDVKPHLQTLVDRLYERVPAGVGSTGLVKVSKAEFRRVVEEGARWCSSGRTFPGARKKSWAGVKQKAAARAETWTPLAECLPALIQLGRRESHALRILGGSCYS